MGAAFWMNSVPRGTLDGRRPGSPCSLVMLFGWFGTVIGESEARLYNKKVDASFRWSMSWFIFSEVMFFFAFFGSLFYIRELSVPDLGGLMSKLVWPEYTASWPTNGPYIDEQFTPMGAIGIPLLNTIILLSSGFTLTVAHHALKAGHRGALKLWLFLDHRAGLHVPGLPGVRIHPCLQRAQPQADDGRLRLDVLHADGVPRRACDDRRDHALRDARARPSRATSTRATTSHSRPPRGTGTSSTSSGCFCSCSCTGSDRAAARLSACRALARCSFGVIRSCALYAAVDSPGNDTTRKAMSAADSATRSASAFTRRVPCPFRGRDSRAPKEARDDRHEPRDDDDLHAARSTRGV